MRKSIFHETWWLDAIAPGRWRQVECVLGGRVAGSLPFVELAHGPFKACAMPQATHILGPTVEARSAKSESNARSTQFILKQLLQQIDAHHHVQMVLDPGFADVTPFLHAGYEIRLDPTVLLNCRSPIDQLWAGLRDKTRNVVRRAGEQLAVEDVDNVDSFARFYQDNLDGDESYFDLAASCAAIRAAREHGQAKIVAATDSHGVTHAMVVFLWDDHQVYYFHSTRNSGVAHVGAVSLLLWHGIELAHARSLWFDFDGGLIKPGRYKFLISFGGEIANRYEATRSTRSWRFHRFVRRVPGALARQLKRAVVPLTEKSALLGLSLSCLGLA
jgi:hypothetical protein